jgi:hypothetical protein
MTNAAGSSGRIVKLRHGGGQSLPQIRVGDKLQFGYATSPYSKAFSANVVSNPTTGMVPVVSATLDQDIPAGLRTGAVVVDTSAAPTVTVAGCTIGNNRARGFWIQTANVLVENCVVLGSSGPAAELRCDVNKWWEGPNPSNIKFESCTFQECNYGPAKNLAVIDSYALNTNGAVASGKIIENLTFSDCNFTDSNTAMAFQSTGEVLVEGCRFPGAIPSTPPILLGPLVSLTSTGNFVPEGVTISAPLPGT